MNLLEDDVPLAGILRLGQGTLSLVSFFRRERCGELDLLFNHDTMSSVVWGRDPFGSIMNIRKRLL